MHFWLYYVQRFSDEIGWPHSPISFRHLSFQTFSNMSAFIIDLTLLGTYTLQYILLFMTGIISRYHIWKWTIFSEEIHFLWKNRHFVRKNQIVLIFERKTPKQRYRHVVAGKLYISNQRRLLTRTLFYHQLWSLIGVLFA